MKSQRIYLVAFYTKLFEVNFLLEQFQLQVNHVDPVDQLEFLHDTEKQELVDRLIVHCLDFQ